MIISGSINHTFSGRKRSTISKVKKVTPVFKAMDAPLFKNNRGDELKQYPSAPMTPYKAGKDTSYKTQHNFTVAPAYNKGAYMVIPRSEVKDIGR